MNLTTWAMFFRTNSKRTQHIFSKSSFGQKFTSNIFSRAEDGRRRARNKKSLQTGAESEILDIPNIAESNDFCGFGKVFQSSLKPEYKDRIVSDTWNCGFGLLQSLKPEYKDRIVSDICGLEKDETEVITGAWMIMEAFVEAFVTQINSLFMIDSRLLSLERKTGLFFSVFDRGRRWKKSTILQLGKEFSSNDAGDGPKQKRKRSKADESAVLRHILQQILEPSTRGSRKSNAFYKAVSRLKKGLHVNPEVADSLLDWDKERKRLETENEALKRENKRLKDRLNQGVTPTSQNANGSEGATTARHRDIQPSTSVIQANGLRPNSLSNTPNRTTSPFVMNIEAILANIQANGVGPNSLPNTPNRIPSPFENFANIDHLTDSRSNTPNLGMEPRSPINFIL